MAYGISPLKVKTTIRDVIKRNKNIKLKNIYLKEYGDSSINYEILITISEFDQIRAARDEIFIGIWYEFKSKGIEIPFSIRTVIMKTMMNLLQISSELFSKVE